MAPWPSTRTSRYRVELIRKFNDSTHGAVAINTDALRRSIVLALQPDSTHGAVAINTDIALSPGVVFNLARLNTWRRGHQHGQEPRIGV
jgi:hypothetical protein